MRNTIFTLTITILAFSITACDSTGTEDDLVESAEQAISFVDAELESEGMERDLAILSDDRLIEEAQEIARFAIDHGCEVRGVLGGVYSADPAVDGGTLDGRWFNRDRSLGGDLEGSYGPSEDEAGGVFDGTWTSADGLSGTLAGDYYGFEVDEADGVFLGQYDEDDGDAAGVLGGLWYDLLEDGGLFFGVWGHCGDDAEAIDDFSY
jgi:hypothetical protein